MAIKVVPKDEMVKAIGTNLDKELKSDQFKKYRTLSDNILVTDYLQWMWLDSKTYLETKDCGGLLLIVL